MVHEGSLRYYISTQEEKGELEVTSDDQTQRFEQKNTLNYEGLYNNDHNLKYRTE